MVATLKAKMSEIHKTSLSLLKVKNPKPCFEKTKALILK